MMFVEERLIGTDLVCFAQSNWELPLMPVHQIMMRMAPWVRILYIEPPIGDLRWRYMKRDALRKRLLGWRNDPLQIHENVYVYSSPPGLPFKRTIRLFNRMTQLASVAAVVKQIHRLGMKDFVLWLTWPTQADLLRKLGESVLVYYVADELSATVWGRQRVIAQMETDILDQADLVIASSRSVYERRKDKSRHIILSPNGVDYNHFSQAAQFDSELPEDLAELPKPILGFSGSIDHRLDLVLLHELAERFSDCSLVLIGLKHRSLRSLNLLPNVHYLGMKSYEQVPLYLAGFDVCLIPYLLNNYTIGLSPLKLIEYLASGKSVVSTAIPACIEHEDLVYIGHSHNEFIGCVEKALFENDQSQKGSRMARARENTWEKRIKAITRTLADVLQNGRNAAQGEQG